MATKLLQLLSDSEYDARVTEPIAQTLKAMKQRVEYEARQLKAIESEMATLLEKHLRYEELAQMDISKSQLLSKLRTILEKTPHLKYLKLWEVLEVYLSFVKEAQVADILGFLGWIGYESSRQAIESTVKTHKHRFTVRKDGWDRFISLAGKESDAPATTGTRK
ncbi:MAG: hypothetical protein ACHP7P_04035 [Terriglobales bacterium]